MEGAQRIWRESLKEPDRFHRREEASERDKGARGQTSERGANEGGSCGERHHLGRRLCVDVALRDAQPCTARPPTAMQYFPGCRSGEPGRGDAWLRGLLVHGAPTGHPSGSACGRWLWGRGRASTRPLPGLCAQPQEKAARATSSQPWPAPAWQAGSGLSFRQVCGRNPRVRALQSRGVRLGGEAEGPDPAATPALPPDIVRKAACALPELQQAPMPSAWLPFPLRGPAWQPRLHWTKRQSCTVEAKPSWPGQGRGRHSSQARRHLAQQQAGSRSPRPHCCALGWAGGAAFPQHRTAPCSRPGPLPDQVCLAQGGHLLPGRGPGTS